MTERRAMWVSMHGLGGGKVYQRPCTTKSGQNLSLNTLVQCL